MEELRKYILKQAIQNDICKEWADKIACATSPDDLLQMYAQGIDFCLDNNFPSNKDLMRLAGDYLPGYGIHVDNDFTQINSRFSVILGNSKASLSYSGYTVAQVFVKHESIADLVLKDNSFVMLDCFDKSSINVVANGNSRITINTYGKSQVTKSGTGKITINHKLKDKY